MSTTSTTSATTQPTHVQPRQRVPKPPTGLSRVGGGAGAAVVFVPQLVAAVAGVGGLSALVGSALAMELPGGLVLWGLIVLAICGASVVSGGYRRVSQVALVLALVLVAITVVAAVSVFEPDRGVATGLVPGAPSDLDVPFLLPWIGTILAGSMGIIWFSYWAATRGYGGGTAQLDRGEGQRAPAAAATAERRTERLQAWFRTLSNTAAIGVLTGTVIITGFLVLGAELLGPAGVVPSGMDVATDLTRLLSEVWGQIGYWLMFAAILVALGGSVLANQDGWSRSFADIVLLLPLGPDEAGGDEQCETAPRGWLHLLTRWRPPSMGPRQALKILFAVSITGVVPAGVIVMVQDPVAIMSVSGIVATIHTPFIVFATLAVNRRLPEGLSPSRASIGALGLSGLFYTVFAVLYFGDLAGVIG